jgi:hypothetical protein
VKIVTNAYAQSDVAHVGDWIEAHLITGGSPRRGQIVELLGDHVHLRYRVRWDEAHESIVYPADGIRIIAADDLMHETTGPQRS